MSSARSKALREVRLGPFSASPAGPTSAATAVDPARRSIPAAEPLSYRRHRPVSDSPARSACRGRRPSALASQWSTFASTTPAQKAANPSGSRLLTPAISEFATAGFLSNHSQDTTDPHAAQSKPASPAFGTRQRRG